VTDSYQGLTPDQIKRSCITYNYWHDLKTDLRKPTSLLDATNMILRRFRLVLVKQTSPERTTWRFRNWLDFLDDVHRQGKCRVCQL
jgi:hypothetical protein